MRIDAHQTPLAVQLKNDLGQQTGERDVTLLLLNQSPGLFLHLNIEKPLGSEGDRHLLDHHRVERLLQIQQMIGHSDPLENVLDLVVGVRRAEHDFHVRRRLPDLLRGHDAVPAGRHPDIHEHQQVGIAFRLSLLNQLQRLFALRSEVQPVLGHLHARTPAGLGGVVKEQALQLLQLTPCPRLAGCEDLPEVLVNVHVIVDDQKPSRPAFIGHTVLPSLRSLVPASLSGTCGNRSVKHAPFPFPSLLTTSRPPISVIALAQKCSPKP